MNPILFPCSHCSLSITVPPDATGRAVPCPHCKQATLVPAAAQPIRPVKSRIGGDGDQGPDFSETLRKAREATDSIFHDQEDDGDSLFGGNDTPRKVFVPPAPSTPRTPTILADPSQPTLRVPGLPDLQTIPAGPGTPLATRALFIPAPAAGSPLLNPFEDLVTDSSPEASNDQQSSGAMVEEEDDEVAIEEVVRRPFPWKNLLIAALALYSIATTGIAAWGWLRSPPANVGKR